MKKRLFTLFFALLLSLISILSLAACGDDDDGPTIEPGPGGGGEMHECSYTTLVSREEPTCLLTGIEVYKCECGATNSVTVAPISHDLGDWTVGEAPTLFNPGYLVKRCKYGCGNGEDHPLPQITPEEYSYEVTKEATLAEAGEAVYTLTYEGKSFSFEAPLLAEGYVLNHAISDYRTFSFLSYYRENGTLPEDLVIPATYAGKPVISVALHTEAGVKTVTVSSGETAINCRGNTVLEKVTYAEGFDSIYHESFKGCTALKEVNFPSTLTDIGNYAFEGCTALKSVDLGDCDRVSFGTRSFYECTALESVILPKAFPEVSVGLFEKCERLRSVVIPEGTETIRSYAFNGCAALTSVTLPAELKKVDSFAFQRCGLLSEVRYLGTLADWCGIAFANMQSNPMHAGTATFLPEGKLYERNSYYVEGALGSAVNFGFDFLVIPAGVTEIGNYQFAGFALGEDYNLVIEGDVTSIGDYAFAGCTIKNIFLSSKVSAISDYAFEDSTVADATKNGSIYIYYGGAHGSGLPAAISENVYLGALADQVKYYADSDATAAADCWCYGDGGFVYEWYQSGSGFAKVLDKAMSRGYTEDAPQ